MGESAISASVDTVIVGNGPSALILSFILHGNIPYYNPLTPHPDPILHIKLSLSPCLLDVDVNGLTAHFAASRLSYSTQALPINVLLDTLIRPLNDTNPGQHESCVEWRFEEERAVSHVVLGDTPRAGGQWADNPVSASWDIGALSYGEMLSLPGYSFGQHYQKLQGSFMPDFYRPTRREMADYLAVYPAAVGIEYVVHTNIEVQGISRYSHGFKLDYPSLTCNNLVLASGVFSTLIPPRPLLQPLSALSSQTHTSDPPLLVVGSGFTAADVIISTPAGREIIHIFKWDPENHPSPLRACHPRAYPEYASIYRRMKLATNKATGLYGASSPIKSKRTNTYFHERDWDEMYEGLPNTYITAVSIRNGSALLTLQMHDGGIEEREISNMEYVIGRRGKLHFLSDNIASEIVNAEAHSQINKGLIIGQTLRPQIEKSLQLAPSIFAIGSLTGDSLIRFAYGGCVFAAREIIKRCHSASITTEGSPTESFESSESLSTVPSSVVGSSSSSRDDRPHIGGHSDLHVDRSARSSSIAKEISSGKLWHQSGWWSGGCEIS